MVRPITIAVRDSWKFRASQSFSIWANLNEPPLGNALYHPTTQKLAGETPALSWRSLYKS
jgi:hypothetical protein